MKKFKIATGLLIGALLTAPLIAVMFFANKLADLAFVPFDFFDWLTRVMPGPLITFGIDTMISTITAIGLDVADVAKTAEQMSAILQFWVMGMATGAIFWVILQWQAVQPRPIVGLVVGALFGLPLIAISLAIGQSPLNHLLNGLWLAILFAGWGLAFGWVSGRIISPPSSPPPTDLQRLSRRQFLVRLGASTATITVAGAGLGGLLARAERQRAEAENDSLAHEVDETADAIFPNANDPVVPAPGTRPEYTPIKDHYKVFIRTEPTVIEAAGYLLPITGLVEKPLMLTHEDIRNRYEARSQYVTLSCISGRVGTPLISTTQWTGASLQEILAEAGLKPNARYLIIQSGDGFYETVDLELIKNDPRIMLCYAWDGNTLPVEHGFPLRIWLPDHFGMKQPKWITNIEVTDTYQDGYWVERNWDKIARVKTTAVIDTIAVDHLMERDGQTYIPVGGIAWAGDKQISKVEVRVDDGPWQEAQLRAPLSETTWVIWRYEWPFAAGPHTFEVRAYEGDGTPQIAEVAPARPSGATGLHSREADIPST